MGAGKHQAKHRVSVASVNSPLPLNARQFAMVGLALAILAVYWLIPKDPQLPENHFQSLVDEHPELVASFSSGNLSLLTETENALVAAEQALSGKTPAAPKEISKPEMMHSPATTNVWSQASTQAAQPSIPLSESVSVYQQVQVDMETPVFPSPGEQVSLALPGGEEIMVDVKTSVVSPNGDYTWRGHLQGYGTDYPVVMTYGGASVFATITTPEGSYTMESIDGSGWIYKNPSEFELSHAGVNDYLEIPLNHLDVHE